MTPEERKQASEQAILELGGKICDWLPHLEEGEVRPSVEVADRALVLNAMIQIYFGAPTEVIAGWIEENGLDGALSRKDREILGKDAEDLSEQERTDLYWLLEALWVMVWAGGMLESVSVVEPVGDVLASLLPNLQRNEGGGGFRERFTLRAAEELHAARDLHYRAHWYARDGKLNGYSTEPFSLDVLMERRRALEWICDREIPDWEETPDST